MEIEEGNTSNTHRISKRTILFGVIPFIVIGAMVVLLLNSSGILFQSSIKPLPEISIEKVRVFREQYDSSICKKHWTFRDHHRTS